jgi:thymidylate synthase
MIVLRARNVHEALPIAVSFLLANKVERPSRNGPVLAAREPVTTVYDHPLERVLFWPERDANPFFHFYEALWMLGGRHDVAPVAHYVKRMREYSDDGVTIAGAYGWRWRHHFLGGDQLPKLIKLLRYKPDTRRAVLQMWDPTDDLTAAEVGARDVPCNLTTHFQVSAAGKLDMTVFCRSNDIVWGCYGANAVHLSYLQEYVAANVGVPVGRYWQVSDNWHAYRATLDPILSLADRVFQSHRAVQWQNPYIQYDPDVPAAVAPYPLVNANTSPPNWDDDLNMFLDEGPAALGYHDPFFRRVAVPMVLAHDAYKQQDWVAAKAFALQVAAADWQLAAVEWLQRRRRKHDERAATEVD